MTQKPFSNDWTRELDRLREENANQVKRNWELTADLAPAVIKYETSGGE